VKAAIRRAGFVPRIKQCFQNCQRLVLFGDIEGATYHEGVARSDSGSAVEHGWIVWRGRVVELTNLDLEPIAGYEVPAAVLRARLMERRAWGSVQPARLTDLLVAVHAGRAPERVRQRLVDLLHLRLVDGGQAPAR